MKRITCLAMGLAMSIGVLTACTKAPMTAPPAQIPYVSLDKVDELQAEHLMAMKKIAQKLNITKEQKAQFKQIFQNYRAKLKTADKEAKIQELKNIVLAENVDATALSNFMNARHAEMKDKTSTIVDLMADLRGVLTDEQRALVINYLNEDMEKLSKDHHQKMEKFFLGDLTLTTEQQTAFNALKDKVKAIHARKIEVMKPAMATFVQTGDKAALLDKIQDLQEELQPPITEAVDFVSSLTLEQRQAIIAKMEALKNKMKKPIETPIATPSEGIISEEPVVAPSEAPAVLPSEEPVVAPSEAPAVLPSEEPVVMPSPSVAPAEDANLAPVDDTLPVEATTSQTCTGTK